MEGDMGDILTFRKETHSTGQSNSDGAPFLVSIQIHICY